MVARRKHMVEAPALAAVMQRDDRQALFDALYRSHRERAVALAHHLVGGDRQAALDAVQEAFARAYAGLDRFRGDAQASTWLYRIVVNEALSAARRRHRGL